eukprot:5189014-Prymnesium_polylepis.1
MRAVGRALRAWLGLCRLRSRRACVSVVEREPRPVCPVPVHPDATWTAQGDYLLVLSLIHI